MVSVRKISIFEGYMRFAMIKDLDKQLADKLLDVLTQFEYFPDTKRDVHFKTNSIWDFGYSKVITEEYTYMLFNLTNITTGYIIRELFILREFDKDRGVFTFSLKCNRRSKGFIQEVSILENLADAKLMEVAYFLSDCLTDSQMQALFKGLDNFV